MSKDDLRLSPDLSVPRSIAARTVFITGTKGSGKSYSAGVLAEEMLSAGVHVVILDPLGVFWGLRHDASGGPGGYPIVILGGEHADVPLLPTGGETVAEFIVRSGQSAILDMSGFAANAEQDRFVTDLLVKLFRLKATEKSALHLIIDEADMFVPQNAICKTEIPLLGATKTIVTKGRSRGLSMTMITQRPQSIAKAAIEEADVVLCHRMQGVNAVKAMKAWTDLYADAEQARVFYESLPQLADGECWVWSPNFLRLFQRVQFRRKHTFDSSRTPDPGETARKPNAAAKVDLDKLTAEMRATAEAAKANDPAALRRRIAELERESARPASPAEPKVVEKVVEVPVLKNGQLDRTEKFAARLEDVGGKLLAEAAELRRLIAPAAAPRTVPTPVRVAASPRPVATRPAPRPAAAPPVAGTEGLTGPQQAILDTVLMLETRGIPATRDCVARWLGIHPNGGRYGSNLGELRASGYLDGFALTDLGRRAARPRPTGIDAALSALPDEPKRQALRAVVDAGRPVSRDELAGLLGIHPNGGRYGSNLGWLRTMGVITERGPIAPTEGLMR